MFTGFFQVISTRKRKKAVDTKGYVLIGEDGLFFERLDKAYLNSPTATMCLLKFLEYCTPVGLLPKYASLWDKLKSDYIRYGYFLLNVRYTIDGDVKDFIYKNPKHFLIKDKDDNENASTFKNIKTGKVYPTFNRDPTIVKSQFKGDYKKYLGQIYMYNDSSQPYRITPMYSVQKWMEAEDDSATYSSKACDNAMFGNNLFIIKKSSDASARELEIIDTVKQTISSVKGVEEAAQNLLLEYSGDIEDVTKLLSKVSISNDIDADLLNATDGKAAKRICTACYGFPEILISNNDGLFGNSGEALETAEKFWANTCLKEANKMLNAFTQIGIPITKEMPQDASTINTDTSTT